MATQVSPWLGNRCHIGPGTPRSLQGQSGCPPRVESKDPKVLDPFPGSKLLLPTPPEVIPQMELLLDAYHAYRAYGQGHWLLAFSAPLTGSVLGHTRAQIRGACSNTTLSSTPPNYAAEQVAMCIMAPQGRRGAWARYLSPV